MKKWWIIALIIVVIIAIIGAFGTYIYYINYTADKNAIKSKELADEIKDVTIDEDIITTSSKEKVVSSEDYNQEEHYIIKEHNDVIGIFKIDSEKNEVFIKDTEIQTKYLPEIDLINLKSGIVLKSEEEVRSALEDFE